MTTIFRFDKQLAEGEDGERVLDEHFGAKYDIIPVPMELQKLGIDRIFQDRETGMRWSVEYKTDARAGDTNNLFVETVSVDATGKLGWAYTSCAQVVVVYTPPSHIAHMLSAIGVKAGVKAWERRHGTKSAQNEGYTTRGVPVPIREVGKALIGKPVFIRPCDDEEEQV